MSTVGFKFLFFFKFHVKYGAILQFKAHVGTLVETELLQRKQIDKNQK